MGEFGTSDCSWKKMVLAKANDEWISTIKYERTDKGESTTGFSLHNDREPFEDIKIKNEKGVYRESYPNDQSEQAPDSMVQELDPLLIEQPLYIPPVTMRRRKGSKPKIESTEKRSSRLAKMSAYAAQRLASETPEQRSLRLKRMSEYAAKRLANESREQRAKRLARMSEYAARRLSKETPEQRASRLARMSAYAAKRQAMKKVNNSNIDANQTIFNFMQQNTGHMMPDQS